MNSTKNQIIDLFINCNCRNHFKVIIIIDAFNAKSQKRLSLYEDSLFLFTIYSFTHLLFIHLLFTIWNPEEMSGKLEVSIKYYALSIK